MVDSCGECNLRAEKTASARQEAIRPDKFVSRREEVFASDGYFMHASLQPGLVYLWRFEGVVCGEVYGQEENPALVRTVILKQTDTCWFISRFGKWQADGF